MAVPETVKWLAALAVVHQLHPLKRYWRELERYRARTLLNHKSQPAE